MKDNKKDLKKRILIYSAITGCALASLIMKFNIGSVINGTVLLIMGFCMGANADRLCCIEEQEKK